ncbi:ABC transporter permease [Halomonas salipaludis]|uniref:Sugar ABC transporter permease n=1 Tax=Halomonas salipaludis TaxID=2032625 RepID=A0A2A2ENN8_9GAMM|nr:ABC transporter permease [Halomonas salipaludis]PAU73977.1 sugar ABC transporter permease [Halomonas salipaludis]
MSSRQDFQLLFLVGINAAIIIAAMTLVGERFMTLYNFQSMGTQIPELGLLALGVMLAMISGRGGIDLSGIALANLSGVVAFMIAPMIIAPAVSPVGFLLSFSAIALGVGVIGGAINGMLIGYAGMTPIIVTLGTQLLFTGIAVGVTGGSALQLGYIPVIDDFGNMPLWGVPRTFGVFILIALALAVLLRYTRFGVHLFLMGSNATAARFAGMRVKSILFRTYLLAGVLASIAGIIIAARTSSVKWDYGTSYVLVAILIAVMAGVRPEGGYGRVTCVVLSAIALQLLSSFFNFMQISNFFRDCAWGLMLLLFLANTRVEWSDYVPAILRGRGE